MASFFRSMAALGLIAGVALRAGAAQSERCSRAELTVDGSAVTARFCVPLEPSSSNVPVTETFSANGRTTGKSTTFPINPDALSSRMADEIELGPLGIKRTLNMTLLYNVGVVKLEHALELPGAIPLK